MPLQIQLIDPALQRGLGFVLLFLLVAPLFPFVYVVLRWRGEEGRQPGAGTQGALLYFRTAAFLLALAGASNLTYGWISVTPVEPALDRLSWGMFVGSLAFLLLNAGLLRVPRPPRDARRVFSGFLMVMAGLVGFTVLILFFITLFERVETSSQIVRRHDELKLYGAWTAFYLGTYLGAVLLLSRGAREP